MEATRSRVVVIGGGYAGVLAALRAARRLRERGEVVLISERDVLVERIRLHESAARGLDVGRPLVTLLRGSGVKLVHARADVVDVVARTVTAGGETWLFDRLIVAIGSRIDASAIPGAREHARSLEPAEAIALGRDVALAAARGGRLLVIGGGLTGIEAATELAEQHPKLQVTLITSGEVAPGFDARAVAHVRAALARLGITLREHARVDRIEAGHAILGDERVPFDVCIGAVGFAMPEALAQWGFPVDARGRARTDAMLRLVTAPHVYVAGDCAAPDEVDGSIVPFGCKSAMPMGVHAAENAVASLEGRAERRLDWSETGYCLSLGRRDGVVQMVRADGSPRGIFVSGRLGAMLKEMVCRYTVRSVELERDGWLEYRFLRVQLRRDALPASTPRSREAA